MLHARTRRPWLRMLEHLTELRHAEQQEQREQVHPLHFARLHKQRSRIIRLDPPQQLKLLVVQAEELNDRRGRSRQPDIRLSQVGMAAVKQLLVVKRAHAHVEDGANVLRILWPIEQRRDPRRQARLARPPAKQLNHARTNPAGKLDLCLVLCQESELNSLLKERYSFVVDQRISHARKHFVALPACELFALDELIGERVPRRRIIEGHRAAFSKSNRRSLPLASKNQDTVEAFTLQLEKHAPEPASIQGRGHSAVFRPRPGAGRRVKLFHLLHSGCELPVLSNGLVMRRAALRAERT